MGHPGGRFPSIPQGPWDATPSPTADPPGYYMGWPLAGLHKRIASGFLDYVVFLFAALMVAGICAKIIRAIAGQGAADAAGFFLFVGAYLAGLYNFSILQGRTGQSWGKRIVGLRSVTTVELRPVGKSLLGIKPIFELFEVVTGLAFFAIAFSYYRQTLTDKFCGVVVIDERKAGMTLPWVLPGEPVEEPARPQPQGGVPWPQSRTVSSRAAPPSRPAPAPSPEPEADLDDLPEPETAWRQRLSAHYHASPSADEIDLPSLPDPGGGPAPSPAGSVGGHDGDADPAPAGGQPAGAQEASPEFSYFWNPSIAEAIRAGQSGVAQQRAREALEAWFEQGLAVDIAEAVQEYRTLIRAQGKAIRVDDATVARWLGLAE